MLEIPWPIVEPMATEPAVAAICAIIPGCLGWAAEAAAAAGGAGGGARAYPAGDAAAVEALRVWAGADAARGAGREERDERYDWDQKMNKMRFEDTYGHDGGWKLGVVVDGKEILEKSGYDCTRQGTGG
jgi:hypothetical protein